MNDYNAQLEIRKLGQNSVFQSRRANLDDNGYLRLVRYLCNKIKRFQTHSSTNFSLNITTNHKSKKMKDTNGFKLKWILGWYLSKVYHFWLGPFLFCDYGPISQFEVLNLWYFKFPRKNFSQKFFKF